jgi:dextranase
MFLILSLLSTPTSLDVRTDLARYCPGTAAAVSVTSPATGTAVACSLSIYHLGREIASLETGSNGVGTWRCPSADGAGYTVVAQQKGQGGQVLAQGSTAIDVSSKWTVHPRYGFISYFGQGLAAQAEPMLEALKTYHLDGIQFYDWQWKHHFPLSPDPTWPDIANRQNSAQTVRAFVQAAHRRGISCEAYNLMYGAWDNYTADGVSPSWGLYNDTQSMQQYFVGMPQGWATSGLWIFNPLDARWRAYLIQHEQSAVTAFGFDGWHVDQLGDPGIKYDSGGQTVYVWQGFEPFLNQIKQSGIGDVIFNNVGGYGLAQTLSSATDAMYLECWSWSGQKTFLDIQNTVSSMTASGKAAVLAAYMDRDLAQQTGSGTAAIFNSNGVLLADAVIFANGGSHIELGDSLDLLDNEYFPNHNLHPSADLLASLRRYYDFLVGYEELLQGSGSVGPANVQIGNVPVSGNGQPGTVWAFQRTQPNRTVVHLVNLLSQTGNLVLDPSGTCPPPKLQVGLTVRIAAASRPAHVSIASPDGDGQLREVPFQWANGTVTVPVDRLLNWTMVVLG